MQLYDAEDDVTQPHYEWSRLCELTFENAKFLFDFAEEEGVELFFSVFHPRYVEWCETIGVKRYKIASTYQREPKELDAVIATEKPVIISLPGAGAPNVRDRQLRDMVERTKWLYCPPGYPPMEVRMPMFIEEEGSDSPLALVFDGFSDHTIGLDASKIALARGATIIEKHFCLSRQGNPAPDIPWSMEPEELAELVRWESKCREVMA